MEEIKKEEIIKEIVKKATELKKIGFVNDVYVNNDKVHIVFFNKCVDVLSKDTSIEKLIYVYNFLTVIEKMFIK